MSVEQGRLLLLDVVADHPLLLLASRGLRGGDRALDAVDVPPVLRSVSLDIRVREHGEHKLTLDLSEEVKESQQVALTEHTLIVATVATDVGRVDEVEGIWRIVASDDLEGIPIFDRGVTESLGEVLAELLLSVAELFGHPSAEVVAEGPVEHTGKAHLRERPDGPSSVHTGEELGVLQDVRCMGMHISGVHRDLDTSLEEVVVGLEHLVKIGHLLIEVVDDLALGGLLGEEYCCTPTERLCIEGARRDQGEDVLKHRLLAPVVGNRCAHKRVNCIFAVSHSYLHLI